MLDSICIWCHLCMLILWYERCISILLILEYCTIGGECKQVGQWMDKLWENYHKHQILDLKSLWYMLKYWVVYKPYLNNCLIYHVRTSYMSLWTLLCTFNHIAKQSFQTILIRFECFVVQRIQPFHARVYTDLYCIRIQQQFHRKINLSFYIQPPQLRSSSCSSYECISIPL